MVLRSPQSESIILSKISILSNIVNVLKHVNQKYLKILPMLFLLNLLVWRRFVIFCNILWTEDINWYSALLWFRVVKMFAISDILLSTSAPWKKIFVIEYWIKWFEHSFTSQLKLFWLYFIILSRDWTYLFLIR